MKLHIFNPEHDIALATNVRRFTAPHAGRQLRADVGFLPALWASDGDMVLVDDVEAALESVRHLRKYVADVLFLSPEDLRLAVKKSMELSQIEVDPWGWDQAIAEQMRQCGLAHLAPSEKQLQQIRELSHRQWASKHLLPKLKKLSTRLTGDAFCLKSVPEDVRDLTFPLVAKAPWSSSGRGIRYIQDEEQWARSWAWVRNVIKRQGSIMIEPFYRKVRDFGMEFFAHADGSIEFLGLSLFHTANGAYVGSIIATEEAKRERLSRYIDSSLLDLVSERICQIMGTELRQKYKGPFGVDMMIVATGGDDVALHPCVELNLRRTMGHAALTLPCDATMPQRLMRIEYTGRYHLRVINTNENVLNNTAL